MKDESVTRVWNNQRVCWERLKGEKRTAERRVGKGTLNPKPKTLLPVPNTPFARSQHASPAFSTRARSTHPSRNQHVQHSRGRSQPYACQPSEQWMLHSSLCLHSPCTCEPGSISVMFPKSSQVQVLRALSHSPIAGSVAIAPVEVVSRGGLKYQYIIPKGPD